MKLLIADEDEKGQVVVSEEDIDIQELSEPSDIFWNALESDGAPKQSAALRKQFVDDVKRWLTQLH